MIKINITINLDQLIDSVVENTYLCENCKGSLMCVNFKYNEGCKIDFLEVIYECIEKENGTYCEFYNEDSIIDIRKIKLNENEENEILLRT